MPSFQFVLIYANITRKLYPYYQITIYVYDEHSEVLGVGIRVFGCGELLEGSRANAETLRIMRRKCLWLYVCPSERKIAQERYQYQACCPSNLWGGMADQSVGQRG